MLQLPPEILVKILRKVENFGPTSHHHTTLSGHNEAVKILYQCALVSRQWNAIVTPELWKRPVIDTVNIKAFILGLLYSIEYDLAMNGWSRDDVELIKQYLSQCFAPQQPESKEILDVLQDNEQFGLDLSRQFELALEKPRLSHRVGKGNYIKRLDLPSWDPLLKIIARLRHYIPHCAMYCMLI